jgi:phosphoadenosine phosphosulfate reductase
MNILGKEQIARMLIRRAIREAGGANKCAVACSFGKDSEVVLHLCLQEAPDINVCFCNTGIEFKDTLMLRDQLVPAWNLNYHEARPEIRFGEIVRKYGLPKVRSTGNHNSDTYGYRTPKCCFYLKDKPADKMYKELGISCIFTGITADESRNRFMLSCRLGKYYYARTEKHYKCHPIMDWSEQDVWDYIASKNIPYNAHYDKFTGHRVGCAACTAYMSWTERMPIEAPKWYRWVQKQRGQMLLCEIGEKAVIET